MSPSSPSRPGDPPRSVRALAVVAAALAAGAVVGQTFWALGAPPLAAVTGDGPDTPTDLLLTGACAVGLGLTAWLVLGALLATAAALPGALGRTASRVADRCAPALVRRAVAAVIGGAIVAGMPVAAHAGPPRPGPVATQVTAAPAPDPAFAVTGVARPADEPSIARPTTPTPTTATPTTPASPPTVTAPDPAFAVTTEAATGSAPARRAPTLGPLGPAPHRAATTEGSAGAPSTTDASDGTLRVRRGDTLWAIAARHLGVEATPAAIAKEWPRWYAANRRLVGADPDLIIPGQVLVVPAPTEPAAHQGAPS